MIELLTGENSFELAQAIKRREVAFDGTVERYEAADINMEQLADIVTGQTLFASKRLVVLDTPSNNASLWHELPNWLKRASDDTHIVLVEPKPDKRTATYKWLKKAVKTEEFPVWTPRDTGLAEEWLQQEAKRRGTALSPRIVKLLVHRIGLDQWQLHHAVEKVRLLDDITEEAVTAITDARPDENVFELFATALGGDRQRLSDMLHALKQTEDPYRVFGLLSGQMIQLSALVLGRPNKNVASDLGASPFMLNKLTAHAARLSTNQARDLLTIAAHTDRRLKSTPADPWLLIEHMLTRASQV